MLTMAPELRELDEELDRIEQDTHKLVAGLTDQQGRWRARPDSWSVAECLDHLAATNRAYLTAMQPVVLRASEQGRHRRGPALPGKMGRFFIKTLEPPVGRVRVKAPRSLRPRPSTPLADVVTSFLASQEEVRAFIRANANLDLARLKFANPFLPALRFRVATALYVIAAHERRHLWQAWRVRALAERAVAAQA